MQTLEYNFFEIVANVNSSNVCESGFSQYYAEVQNGNKHMLQIELSW